MSKTHKTSRDVQGLSKPTLLEVCASLDIEASSGSLKATLVTAIIANLTEAGKMETIGDEQAGKSDPSVISSSEKALSLELEKYKLQIKAEQEKRETELKVEQLRRDDEQLKREAEAKAEQLKRDDVREKRVFEKEKRDEDRVIREAELKAEQAKRDEDRIMREAVFRTMDMSMNSNSRGRTLIRACASQTFSSQKKTVATSQASSW